MVGSNRDSMRRPKVLWIDDQVDEAAVRLLTIDGFDVDCASHGADGLRKAATREYDAIVLDLALPDMFGMTVQTRLTFAGIDSPVLVVTGHYLEDEVEAEAIQRGAVGFARKPLDADEVARTLWRNVSVRLRQQQADGASTSRRDAGLRVAPSVATTMIAVSAEMRVVTDWIHLVARNRAPVLLTGETGTGKEVVAQAIHRESHRSHHAFLPVNCGAIPESLIESELFGHRKGAFTGAVEHQAGLIEAADGGTLFLDEVAEMPLVMQVRFLRFLEDGVVRRVGETRSRTVDVRVIAATNRSLREEIRRGRFREDLHYRLAVMECHLPALRERLDDLKPLTNYWLRRFAEESGSRVIGVSPEALMTLRAHRWPGNVRELRNVLERAASVASSEELTVSDVVTAITPRSGLTADRVTDENAETIEGTLKALQQYHGKRTRTARALGINRTTLWRRLRRWEND